MVKRPRLDEEETSGDSNQRASVGGKRFEKSSHSADRSKPSDENVHFVSDNPGLDAHENLAGSHENLQSMTENHGADDNLAPPTANMEVCEPLIRSSEPVLQTNVAGAGKFQGFKKRPLVFKKSGKKLFTRSGNPKIRSFLQFGSKTQDIRRPVKHFKRTGPSFNFECDDRDVQMLLDKFGDVVKQYKKAKRKPSEAFRDFRHEYWYLLCNGRESIIGPVPGVKVGMCFVGRRELFLVGVHQQMQAGIDFIPEGRSPVMIDSTPAAIAVSVVVTGSFEDDVDEGEKIQYCGEGGRPYEGASRGEQASHQTLTKGNLALHNTAKLGRAVRVIRKHRDDSSPFGHVFIYSYDGMYKVSRVYSKRGRNGYKVFMFELNRLPNQEKLRW